MRNNLLTSPEATTRIKEMKAIRVLCLPFIRIKRLVLNKRYGKSGDAQKVKLLENKYNNETCFIIGNGESLNISDLEKLKGIMTFASNRIYKVFDKTKWRPDFYVAFEPDFVKANVFSLVNIDANKIFLNIVGKQRKLTIEDENKSIWINCYSSFCINRYTINNISFSRDLSKYVGDAYSVTFTALQLAVYMGFKRIYLIGMDNYKSGKSFSHFYENKDSEYRTETFLNGIEYGYKIAREAAENQGVKIYNATRGGNLEVFERVNFDEVLKELLH